MEQAPSVERYPQGIDEILEHHEGEWLLIEVLDTTVPLGKSPGVVLAHGPDRNAMFKAERKARKREPKAVLAILGGGIGLADGDALRRELARVAAEEEWVSVNKW